MLQHLAEGITFFLLKKEIISIDDSDIYIYGFQVIISTLIVTMALFLVGLLFNAINLTLVFMIVFMLLRMYSGGFHCKKFRYCLLTSTSIFAIELFLNEIIRYEFKVITCIVISIISLIIIFKLSPVEDKNNPLSKSNKEKYRKITRIIAVIIFLSIVIGIFIDKGLIDYFFIMSLTLTVVAVLLIIPLCRELNSKLNAYQEEKS